MEDRDICHSCGYEEIVEGHYDDGWGPLCSECDPCDTQAVMTDRELFIGYLAGDFYTFGCDAGLDRLIATNNYVRLCHHIARWREVEREVLWEKVSALDNEQLRQAADLAENGWRGSLTELVELVAAL